MPGLVETIGIDHVETLNFHEPVRLNVPVGTLAFDGEREVTISERDEVCVTLRDAAFRTINVAACMAHVGGRGHFVEGANRIPHLNITKEERYEQ